MIVSISKPLTIITHTDSDGVLCVTLFFKYLQKKGYSLELCRTFFTSPAKLLDTLCVSIIGSDTSQLCVFDIAGKRESLLAAAIYEHVEWVDHHEWDTINLKLDNVNLYIDPSVDSATTLLSKYLNFTSGFESYADEIDKNRVKSISAKMIRDIVGAYKLQFTGIELSRILHEFSQRLAKNDVEELFDKKYDSMVKNYELWIENAEKLAFENLSIHKIKGLKVAVIHIAKSCPVYRIVDKLHMYKEAPFDVIVVAIRSMKNTKIEFRTHTNINVYQLAKMFGGGGHISASGATICGELDTTELLTAIERIKL